MDHYVLAYATNKALPLFTQEDLHSLTHINLAFGVIKDGVVDISQLTNLHLLPTFRSWNPQIKIVLSVGGWGAGGFSTMAMTAEGRAAFAASCLRVVEQYALDGIDIDWEYPCNDQAEIDADPADKEHFTLLLQALRDALGAGRIVSIAAGAGDYFVRDTQMDRVAQVVDYVQLMTYDMRGGFTHQTGHHAALRASKGDTSGLNTVDMVNMFHAAGVPLEKIVVGAAFYSRRWTGVHAENETGLLQTADSVGTGGPRYSDLTPAFVEEGGYTRLWDEDAQADYLWNGNTFISYESPRAIALKCRYVKDAGLLGLMYWEHGCDLTHELLRTVATELPVR